MPIIVSSASNVQPADVALTLGRSTPADDSTEFSQWALWISDAETVISERLGDITLLDQGVLSYVVREAVALKVKRPDAASSTTVSVDDGTVTKRYERAAGAIIILDEWWQMLAPAARHGLFSTRPGFEPDCAPTTGLDWS